eukprot:gene17131-22645_t
MSASSAPKTVGNYDLLRKLGRGSFADVYLAVNKINGSQVAFKVISKEKVIDPKNPKLQDNLDNEISIMRDYRHQNIVRLFDSFHSPRFIYLVLELCPGGDLSIFIKRNKRLDERVAKNFLCQLAKGLTFLNQKNIIHRDLKPANVLLSENSNNAILKLADFGFAKQLAEAAMAQTQCGTPYYMAPEIFEMRDYDSRADIWSTGCIYFEMLTGSPPFKGSNPKDLLNNIRSKPFVFPIDISITKESYSLLTVDINQRATLQQLCSACEVLTNPNSRIINSESDLFTPLNTSLGVSYAQTQVNSESTNTVSGSLISSPPASTRLTLNNPSSSTTTFAMNLNNNNLVNSVSTSMKSNSPAGISQIMSMKKNNTASNLNDIADINRVNRGYSIDSNAATNSESSNLINNSKPFEFDLKKSRSVSVDSTNINIINRNSSNNGESWSSTEEDFVIVEATGTYLNNRTVRDPKSDSAMVLPNFPGSQNISKNIKQSHNESEIINGLIQYCENTNILVIQVCIIGDSFIDSINKLYKNSLFNFTQSRNIQPNFQDYTKLDYQFMADSFLSAFSIYNHALKINSDALFYFLELSKSISNIQTVEKLKQGLNGLIDGLLVRTENCSKIVKSIVLNSSELGFEGIVVNIPNAEPILYSIAIKMSGDAKIENHLGNFIKSSQYLSSAKLLLESLLYTVKDNNTKIIQQQLVNVSNQLEGVQKLLPNI